MDIYIKASKHSKRVKIYKILLNFALVILVLGLLVYCFLPYIQFYFLSNKLNSAKNIVINKELLQNKLQKEMQKPHLANFKDGQKIYEISAEHMNQQPNGKVELDHINASYWLGTDKLTLQTQLANYDAVNHIVKVEQDLSVQFVQNGTNWQAKLENAIIDTKAQILTSHSVKGQIVATSDIWQIKCDDIKIDNLTKQAVLMGRVNFKNLAQNIEGVGQIAQIFWGDKYKNTIILLNGNVKIRRKFVQNGEEQEQNLLCDRLKIELAHEKKATNEDKATNFEQAIASGNVTFSQNGEKMTGCQLIMNGKNGNMALTACKNKQTNFIFDDNIKKLTN